MCVIDDVTYEIIFGGSGKEDADFGMLSERLPPALKMSMIMSRIWDHTK